MTTPIGIATKEAPAARVLPDCFRDHNAPPSVVSLFNEWVEHADATDTAQIEIRLDRQQYSRRTVALALHWLTTHRLLMRTRSGRGRSCGSTFFVRWSFTDSTLRDRQARRNHPKRIPSESAKGFEAPYTRAKEVLEEQIKSKSTPQDVPVVNQDSKSIYPRGCAPSIPAQNLPTQPPDVHRWLEQTHLDRLPSYNERRALAAAIHKLDNDSRLVEPLLAALFRRRKSLPLRVWSAALDGLSDARFKSKPRVKRYHGAGVVSIDKTPENDWTRCPTDELTWRARQAIKTLACDPSDVAGFRRILADGPNQSSGQEHRAVEHRLAGIKRSLAEEFEELSLVQQEIAKRIETARCLYGDLTPAELRKIIRCPVCGRLMPPAGRLGMTAWWWTEHSCLRNIHRHIKRLEEFHTKLAAGETSPSRKTPRSHVRPEWILPAGAFGGG